jgi:hypothetical protein
MGMGVRGIPAAAREEGQVTVLQVVRELLGRLLRAQDSINTTSTNNNNSNRMDPRDAEGRKAAVMTMRVDTWKVSVEQQKGKRTGMSLILAFKVSSV